MRTNQLVWAFTAGWIVAVVAACTDRVTSDDLPELDAQVSQGVAGEAGVNEQKPPVEAGATSDSSNTAQRDATSVDGDDATASLDSGTPQPFCGDRSRDPEREQCDDGPGDEVDPCTPDCRLRDVVFVSGDTSDAGATDYVLGSGPHTIAANDVGIGIAFVAQSGDDRAVYLSRFDERGGAQGEKLEVSEGATPALSPDPVSAVLPDGSFVVAWADRASGTPDIRLRRVDTNGNLGALTYAHDFTSGSQEYADLLWLNNELLIAYSENFDIRVRHLGQNLAPLDSPAAITVSSALDTSVALAPFGNSYAIAWRQNVAGEERILVRMGDIQWSLGTFLPGLEGERPKVAELDATHILVVFTEATDPFHTGVASVGRLRWAILDTAQPGDVLSVPLTPQVAPYKDDVTLGQRRPSLTVVQGHVYVAWESGASNVTEGTDVWLSEVSVGSVDASDVSRSIEEEISILGTTSGDQSQPVLGTSPLASDGALVLTWESTAIGTSGHQLMFGIRPVPFLK